MPTSAEDFVPLTRDSPWRAQVGCGAVIALLLGLVGGGFLYATHHYYGRWDLQHDGMSIVFGCAFGSVGVLMALTTIHQALAIRSPETHIAIRPGQLRVADMAFLRVRQPGPLRLRSLHARLVCEVRTRHESEKADDKWYYTTTFPYQERIYACDDAQDVPASGQFEQTASFHVPFDAPVSAESANERVVWRIEL